MSFSEKFKYIYIYGCLIFGGLLAFIFWFMKYLNNESTRLDVTVFTTVLCLVGGCVWGWVMYKRKIKN